MITKLSKTIHAYLCWWENNIRADLQLHFLWSFFLTTSAVFFPLMIWSGLIATLIKETLDLWTKGKWNWDDVAFGIAGWIFALFFLQQI